MDGDNQRNLLLAIALSVAILIGFNLFFEQPAPPPEATQQAGEVDTRPSASGTGAGGQPGSQALDAVGDSQAAAGLQSREQAIEAAPRVAIDTPALSGSISLLGAKLDDLVLKRYHETVDPQSPEIVLLNPAGGPNAYFAEFGWVAGADGIELPDRDSRWRADAETLSVGNPVTLSWENEAGLVFEQVYSVDDDYLFTVTQRLRNRSGEDLAVAPFGLVSRTGTPETSGFYLLHEGLIGVLDETLKEVDYDEAREDGPITYQSTGGWIGITDKYWMATLVPDQQSAVTARFVSSGGAGGLPKYQADYLYDMQTVADGGTLETTSRLFAGAKRVTLLDEYADRFGIEKFDLAVDFGWFYFLTKPIFLALHWLHSVIGNFGVAILVLTVGIKLLFFPLANKSYKSMAKMRKLQPEIVKLRERFSDDKQRLNQEVMGLYKREGANPISGCLPVLVQIPVFFALYKVLFVTLEMRHAPFFGWIQDLSAPDPTTVLNLFGLLPWARPELGALDIVNLGVWPLLMGLTMFIQQRLNPQPADPMQAKIFTFMPIIFTFLLASFPAGLVIYWTWNNLLSVIQQAVIMKRQGVPFGGKQDFLPNPKAGTRASSKTAKEGGSNGDDEPAAGSAKPAGGKKGKGKAKATAAAGAGTAEARSAGEAAGDPAGEPANDAEAVSDSGSDSGSGSGSGTGSSAGGGTAKKAAASGGGGAKPRARKGGARSRGRSRSKAK